ncbi:unnamed protein product, partial [Protopolystoma xenopodis]
MALIQCETQGEQAYQQIVSQKLIGLHLPTPRTAVALLRDLMLDLRRIREEMQVCMAPLAMSSGQVSRMGQVVNALRRASAQLSIGAGTSLAGGGSSNLGGGAGGGNFSRSGQHDTAAA